MKRPAYFLLLILLLCSSKNIYSQEEFFGDNDGFSPFYLKGFSSNVHNVNAGGFSLYFKSGIGVGLAYENVDDQYYPVFALFFYPDSKDKLNRIKPCFQISYSYGYEENIHVFGFSTGLIKCFFPESNYPFSINGSFSAQMEINKINQNTQYSVMQDTEYNITPILGFGYTQTFFAKGKIYPFIGISYSYQLTDAKINLFSAMIGLNIKI